MMKFKFQELLSKKEDAQERLDLPIEDFLDWGGFIRLIDSHIEVTELLKKQHEITERQFSSMCDFQNKIHELEKQVEQQQKEINKLKGMNDMYLDTVLENNKEIERLEKQLDVKPVTFEEKSKLILKLVNEIVEETKDREDNIGGLMRSFGNDYILRMQTFANFFKGVK